MRNFDENGNEFVYCDDERAMTDAILYPLNPKNFARVDDRLGTHEALYQYRDAWAYCSDVFGPGLNLADAIGAFADIFEDYGNFFDAKQDDALTFAQYAIKLLEAVDDITNGVNRHNIKMLLLAAQNMGEILYAFAQNDIADVWNMRNTTTLKIWQEYADQIKIPLYDMIAVGIATDEISR